MSLRNSVLTEYLGVLLEVAMETLSREIVMNSAKYRWANAGELFLFGNKKSQLIGLA
jgi:hypothetical protein